MKRYKIIFTVLILFIVSSCATAPSDKQAIYKGCMSVEVERAKEKLETEKEAKYAAHLLCNMVSNKCSKQPETCKDQLKKYNVDLKK